MNMTANTKNIPPHSHDTSQKPTQSHSTVGNYLICERIGQGSFATVYKAQHKVSGHFVAIKSVLRSKLTKKLLENLESEISILKAIRHDHIVGLSECQKTNTHIHLVMDYCAMGDLSQYIKQIRSSKTTQGPLGGLPEDTVRHFLHQLALALQFLRSQNLVHRDIKPQNLLLVSPQPHGTSSSSPSSLALPILRVADFGFARFLPNASMADTLCGSPLYMGPEILSYQKYDAKADLWSVGAVLYEMMTGRPPFHAQNHLELLKKIQDNKDVIRFPKEKQAVDGQRSPPLGEDLKDLTRKLLKKEPVERLSFEEFFAHRAILLAITSSTSNTSIAGLPPPPIHATTTATPPLSTISAINHRHDLPTTSYEPPPFAQPSRTAYQNSRQRTSELPSPTRHTQDKNYRTINDVDGSPIHSRGRSGKTVEFNDLHESRSAGKPSTERGDDEDVIHDYVMVLERRVIATNQFADEMNNTPHNDNGKQTAPQKPPSTAQMAIPRRKSSSSSSSLSAASSNPPSSTSPNTPPFTASSREKRTSAGFAFTKALTLASERLFGHYGDHSPSPPNDSIKSQQTTTTMAGSSPRGFLMTGGATAYSGNNDDDDDNDSNKTMAMIEKAACMAHAVAKFADTKSNMLFHDGSGGGDILGVAPNESTLAAEALVLHLKALELLELGLDMAKTYWYERRPHNSSGGGASDTRQQQRQHDDSAARLNDAVQWMRDRFNECLDRASTEKSKCESNVHSSYDSSSGINPCVEKLLFERALEMSRAAAVHELVGENFAECEQDYQTAIWMLEAILEVGDDKDMVIEDGDQNIINNFIDSIKQRILVLRRKLSNHNEQQYPHNKYGPRQALLIEDR